MQAGLEKSEYSCSRRDDKIYQTYIVDECKHNCLQTYNWEILCKEVWDENKCNLCWSNLDRICTGLSILLQLALNFQELEPQSS